MFLSRTWDAYHVYLVRAGITSLAYALIFTNWMLFQIDLVGLDALQLVLIGTMLEVTTFVFEIPTGVVADVYSRRLSIIIGVFLIGAAFLVQGLFPTFAVLLFAQFLWGVGYTFTSGASDAWLVDEIGSDRAGLAFTRGLQLGNLAAIPGIVLSVVLASLHLALPLFVGSSLILALGVLLVLVMPENGFKPQPRAEISTWGNMTGTFREGLRVVRGSPTLISMLGVGLFYGLFSEGWDRLWQYHLLQNFGLPWFTPVVWFGLFSMILMLTGIGAAEFLRRRLDMTNGRSMARVLFGLTAVMVVSLVVYGLALNVLVAILAMIALSVARVLIGPIFSAWSNQHIASDVRATVLSMQSQTDAIGQMFGGPPLGIIGQMSLRLAFIASGALLSPAIYLLYRAERGTKRKNTPDSPVVEAAVSGD